MKRMPCQGGLTLELLLSSLGVAASVEEVVTDTTGTSETEGERDARLGHDCGVVFVCVLRAWKRER